MIPIKDLLSKINWDAREKPEEYVLWYVDFGKLKPVPYLSIKRFEGNFMVIEKQGKEVEIPLHRVRKVMKGDKVVWQRSPVVLKSTSS